MTAYTDFHYSPTGSGVISGSQVLEQTEQGINGLGQYVQDNVSGAIDTANEALTTARSADSNATTAINLANSFNAQIIAANQTAGNALTTAQSAQNTANAASSLATTADNNAATALNAANSASAGVTTLTGTVNSLGNRMTAAENAINTNAGNITTLQNNLATTNANVTAAANAANAAQATATSAQATATLARNQAYVLRYTGTTITGGGTIAYADIDNTDNIKAGDKIIDISGAIYDIVSVDIANQTVTVGASPVINLFCDAENLIPAANDAYDLGSSSYQWNNLYANSYHLKSASAELGITGGFSTIKFQDKNNKNLAGITLGNYSAGKLSYSRFSIYDKNSNNQEVEEFVELAFLVSNQQFYFRPSTNNKAYLGTSNTKWKDFYTNLINGEKPGSLGLPNMTNSLATEVDITDWYIQDPDFPDDPTKKIIDDSVEQTVSSSFPGWLWIQFENVSGNYAYARQTQAITNMSNERIADGLATDVFPTIHFVFPIINSLKVRIRSKSATVRIFPCLGNV